MTEDEKRILKKEFEKAGSVPALLEAMERSESKEFRQLKEQIGQGTVHPTGDELYNYVLGWLDRKESLLIMDHLVLCGTCLREVIRIKRLEEALTQDALARADRVPWLDRVKRLISDLSFPVSIYEPALGSVRGADQEPQERRYRPGTELVISAEAPADGYMTVFHGCEETQKVELVFPLESDDDPRVLAGKEIPPIAGTVEGPAGKQWLRVFWTREMIMDPTAYRLEDVLERERASEVFLDAMEDLDKADFAIGTWEYTVVME